MGIGSPWVKAVLGKGSGMRWEAGQPGPDSAALVAHFGDASLINDL